MKQIIIRALVATLVLSSTSAALAYDDYDRCRDYPDTCGGLGEQDSGDVVQGGQSNSGGTNTDLNFGAGFGRNGFGN